MITLDGQPLFSSGPCELTPLSWHRRLLRRELPGLNGEIVLDLGVRGRLLRQTGRLQASSAFDLNGLLRLIVAFQDGRAHTLVDNHGITYPDVLVTSFELTTPLTAGRGFWADYRMEYLQLP